MRVFSGIQPTGIPHLGNYFGALTHWVALQNEGHTCFYSIVNQHALTVPQNAKTLQENTVSLAAVLFSIGLDPEKSTIFVQSDVPAHAEFAWILSCLAPMGQMERMIQFKEKSEKSPSSANLGLLSYPVLQAADILLYKADLVPVGIDQAQHLELTRDLAKKCNNAYNTTFSEPKTLHTKVTKVVGLDGKSKMSKSYNNHIGIVDDEKTLWDKLGPAVTDPARIKKSDPGNPDICNIYKLHELMSSKEDVSWARTGCKGAQIGCIECKKKLYTSINNLLEPIRENYHTWISNPNKIYEALAHGSKCANAVANETLKEVYDKVGLIYKKP